MKRPLEVGRPFRFSSDSGYLFRKERRGTHMDPNYYVTTLTSAAMKLGPGFLYLIGGYFLFIKLPFWLMSKVVIHNRPSPEKLAEYEAFIAQMNVSHLTKTEEKKNGERPQASQQKTGPGPQKTKSQSQSRVEDKKFQDEQKRKEQRKKTEQMQQKTSSAKVSPEEVLFGLRPGAQITKDFLKKKYHELLKVHHPDKVATLAPQFRSVAEFKTKEINSAYDKLKKKAA